jgi:hypothetical protein
MAIEHDVTKKSLRFNLATSDALALFRADEASHAFEFHRLVELLGDLPGVSNVEYDGHFGPHVFADIVMDDDRFDEATLAIMVERTISLSLDDAHRLHRLMPGFTEGPAHRKHTIWKMVDDADRKFVYSDPDFVIFESRLSGDIEIFHHVDGKAVVVATTFPDALLRVLEQDEFDRRIDEEQSMKMLPARGLDEVRAWVAEQVVLPDHSYIRTAGLDTDHRLAGSVGEGSRPIHVTSRAIVAAREDGTVSLHFVYGKGSGTKTFMDAAAEQVREMIRNTASNASASDILDRWIARQTDENTHGGPSYR